MMRYEPIRPPRFRKDIIPGGYEFVVPSRKNMFALLFMPVWLIFWTFGGVMAISEFVETGQVFLAFWLLGWTFGWLFVAITIVYMAAGAEVIRYSGGDLSIGFRLFGLNRLKHFRSSEIKSLNALEGPDDFTRMFGWSRLAGPFSVGRVGTVRFNHGARTYYAGERLDLAEAELIIADLLRSIPGAA